MRNIALAAALVFGALGAFSAAPAANAQTFECKGKLEVNGGKVTCTPNAPVSTPVNACSKPVVIEQDRCFDMESFTKTRNKQLAEQDKQKVKPKQPTKKVTISEKTQKVVTEKKIVTSGGAPTPPACAPNGIYNRKTNELFSSFNLMWICDASGGADNNGHSIGAVNLKGIDDVSKKSRPSSGPVYTPDGCVVTAPGSGSKFAWNRRGDGVGCRDVLTGAAAINGKLVLTIGGHAYLASGGFGGVSLKRQ